MTSNVRMVAAVILLMTLTACRNDGAPPVAAAPTGSAPSATPTSPPTPAPTTSPPTVTAALLTPGDLGPGYAVDSDSPGDPESVRFASACPSWRPPAGMTESEVVAASHRLFRAPRGHYDGTEVLRYAGDGAAAAMAYAKRRLTACTRHEEIGDPGVMVATTWTVLATDFAGADSVAVRQRIERNGVVSNVDFHLLVRQGDLLAYLWLSDQRWTEKQLRALGERVAARLCAATEAC